MERYHSSISLVSSDFLCLGVLNAPKCRECMHYSPGVRTDKHILGFEPDNNNCKRFAKETQ